MWYLPSKQGTENREKTVGNYRFSVDNLVDKIVPPVDSFSAPVDKNRQNPSVLNSYPQAGDNWQSYPQFCPQAHFTLYSGQPFYYRLDV
jgi:hypothetical protein